MTSIKAPTVAIQALRRDIQMYEQHVNKLRLAKAALQGTSASPAKRLRKDGGTRTALITEILQGATKSMNVDEIYAALVAKGRSDEQRKKVASAMPYLGRKGVAKTIERGQWVAVTAEVVSTNKKTDKATAVQADALDQKAA